MGCGCIKGADTEATRRLRLFAFSNLFYEQCPSSVTSKDENKSFHDGLRTVHRAPKYQEELVVQGPHFQEGKNQNFLTKKSQSMEAVYRCLISPMGIPISCQSFTLKRQSKQQLWRTSDKDLQ